MKIEFEENCIKLVTENLLERLYLERLDLKNEGDICNCVLTYSGSYTAIKLMKAEEKVEEEDSYEIGELIDAITEQKESTTYLDRIDRNALLMLCDYYDTEQGEYPESAYEGEAIYDFYLKRVRHSKVEESEAKE